MWARASWPLPVRNPNQNQTRAVTGCGGSAVGRRGVCPGAVVRDAAVHRRRPEAVPEAVEHGTTGPLTDSLLRSGSAGRSERLVDHDVAGEAQGDVCGPSVTEDLARAMGDAATGGTTRPSSAVALAAPGGQVQLLLLLGPAARHDLIRLTLFIDDKQGNSAFPWWPGRTVLDGRGDGLRPSSVDSRDPTHGPTAEPRLPTAEPPQPVTGLVRFCSCVFEGDQSAGKAPKVSYGTSTVPTVPGAASARAMSRCTM
jgi:hypothetical protein